MPTGTDCDENPEPGCFLWPLQPPDGNGGHDLHANGRNVRDGSVLRKERLAFPYSGHCRFVVAIVRVYSSKGLGLVFCPPIS